MSKKPTVKELTEHLQRLQAEFDNFRRRTEADRSGFTDIAKQEIILQVLPLMDSIGRALLQVPNGEENDVWAKGISHIDNQGRSILKNLNVKRIHTVNQLFDPHFHEAISVEGEGDKEFVEEELQPGYMIGDKVIRHAIVKVRRSK